MATTFNVYRDGTKVKSGLTSKSFEDTGLTPNTEYKYQVSSQNAAGESEKSNAVTVTTDYSAPTGVSISPQNNNLTVGGTRTLSATVEPSTAQQGVSWSSSDESIATVSGSGKVTAVAAGTATITATSTADNSVNGTATINVTAA